ncbi:MAG: GerMN domain-containing protein [Candidatus Paceibacterota bacterium]|jgi:hypothetical protein
MKITKKTLIYSAVVAAIITLAIMAIFRGNEDDWICENHQWVKHGHPSASMPSEPCGNIVLDKPTINEEITSPLLIEGRARGTWYFEASFPIKLIDGAGNVLATGIAQAQGDWMTEDFVPFKASLDFKVDTLTIANLVLVKDNPSGLPENDDQMSVPINLISSEKMTINVYFNNSKLDPEITCEKVFPVKREIPKTQAVARAAIEELLKGPTDEEKQEEYSTAINDGVKVQSLTIDKEIAKIDFNKQLEFQVGGSCRVAAIAHQITETLKQFLTVKDVIISIDGRTEDILQP